MKNFQFIQDVKNELWFRRFISVQAENEEDALEMVEKYKTEEIDDNDLEENVEIISTEWLTDTSDGVLDPAEYNASIELLDEKKDVIGDNVPLRVLQRYERVFSCTYAGKIHGWGVMKDKAIIYHPEDKVAVILDNGDEISVESCAVYGYPADTTKVMMCPRCGRMLCWEHNNEVDYMYYCPECDENFL